MSSSISPTTIDGTFPIAGQDNDSGGFRTNFTNIRTNFIEAKFEVEDLQHKAVLLQPLSGGNLVANNFAGTLMSGATTKGFTQTFFDGGAPTTGIAVSFANGDSQKFLVSAAQALTIDWTSIPAPASSRFSKIRVLFVVPNNAYSITFPVSVNIGTGAIPGYVAGVFTSPLLPALSIAAPGNYIFEFSTTDGVNTTVVQLLGPLSDTAAGISILNTEITALQGNVSTLQTNFASNVTTINGLVSTTGVQTNEIATINSTLMTTVVHNNASNILNGNIISGAAQRSIANTTALNAVVIDLALADLYNLTVTGNITSLSFINWSSVPGAYSRVRVFFSLTLNQTVQFATTPLYIGLNNVAGTVGTLWTAPKTGYYLFEFSSFAGGTSILVDSIIVP